MMWLAVSADDDPATLTAQPEVSVDRVKGGCAAAKFQHLGAVGLSAPSCLIVSLLQSEVFDYVIRQAGLHSDIPRLSDR